MAGKLLSLPGEFPTLNDWENHLTTIYPEVCYLCGQYPFFVIFCKRILRERKRNYLTFDLSLYVQNNFTGAVALDLKLFVPILILLSNYPS